LSKINLFTKITKQQLFSKLNCRRNRSLAYTYMYAYLNLCTAVSGSIPLSAQNSFVADIFAIEETYVSNKVYFKCISTQARKHR